MIINVHLLDVAHLLLEFLESRLADHFCIAEPTSSRLHPGKVVKKLKDEISKFSCVQKKGFSSRKTGINVVDP
jgi:hypothetical protein